MTHTIHEDGTVEVDGRTLGTVRASTMRSSTGATTTRWTWDSVAKVDHFDCVRYLPTKEEAAAELVRVVG